jgi:chromosome segregation ATPase
LFVLSGVDKDNFWLWVNVFNLIHTFDDKILIMFCKLAFDRQTISLKMAKEDKINFLNERRNYLQFVRLDDQLRSNGDQLDSASVSKGGSSPAVASSDALLVNPQYPGTSFKLVQYPPDLISTNISQNGSCSEPNTGESTQYDLTGSGRKSRRWTRHSNSDSNTTDNDSLLSENSFVANQPFELLGNGFQRKSQRNKTLVSKEVQCEPIVIHRSDADCQVDLDVNELYVKLQTEYARTRQQLDSMSFVVEGMVRERSTLFLRMHEMSKRLATADEEQQKHSQDSEQIKHRELEFQAYCEQRQKYIDELEKFKVTMTEKSIESEQIKLELDTLMGKVNELTLQKEQLQTLIDSKSEEYETIVKELTQFQDQNVEQIKRIDDLNEQMISLQQICNDLQSKLNDEQQQKAHLKGKVETACSQNQRLTSRLEQLVTSARDKEQFLVRQVCVWEQQLPHILNNTDQDKFSKWSMDQVHDESLLVEHCSRFWKTLIESLSQKSAQIEQLEVELHTLTENACLDSERQTATDKQQFKQIAELVDGQTQTEMNIDEIERLRDLVREKQQSIESLELRQELQNGQKNAEIDRLNNRISDLISSLEQQSQEFEQRRSTLEDRLNDEREQIRYEKNDQMQIRQDLETIKTALLESNRLLNLQNDENRHLQQKIVELHLDAEQTEVQMNELKTDNGKLRQTIENGEGDAQSECACLQLSLKERDELIDQLTNEVEALKKKVKFLNEK